MSRSELTQTFDDMSPLGRELLADRRTDRQTTSLDSYDNFITQVTLFNDHIYRLFSDPF